MSSCYFVRRQIFKFIEHFEAFATAVLLLLSLETE